MRGIGGETSADKFNTPGKLKFYSWEVFDSIVIDWLFQLQQAPGRGIGQVPVRRARNESLLDILGLVVVIGNRDSKTE